MKYLIFILILAVSGCKIQKPQERVVYKFVKDTTVIKKNTSIVLPVKNITILDRPCKDNSLIIPTQIIENENSSLKISSKEGRLVVESSTDSIVSTDVNVTHISKDVEVKEVEVFIDKPYRDRWFWGSISANLLLLVWIFKKPIISILRRFILPI